VGDWAARDVTKTQPIKLAAIEGLYKTTRGASEHILGWYTHGQVKYGIAIPHLLSVLATHSWNGKVTGLQTVPADQRPAINIVRFAFQTMVGIGTLLGLLALWLFAIWIRRKRLPETAWFYRAVVLAGPASLVALIAGWVVTEVGRQPWVVYHVMPTAAAVTGAHGIPVGYGTLAASYVLVACGLAWVLRRLARSPLRLVDESEAGLEPA
jgi:cytochrome d ubiquinol oxidase subunit I